MFIEINHEMYGQIFKTKLFLFTAHLPHFNQSAHPIFSRTQKAPSLSLIIVSFTCIIGYVANQKSTYTRTKKVFFCVFCPPPPQIKEKQCFDPILELGGYPP